MFSWTKTDVTGASPSPAFNGDAVAGLSPAEETGTGALEASDTAGVRRQADTHVERRKNDGCRSSADDVAGVGEPLAAGIALPLTRKRATPRALDGGLRIALVDRLEDLRHSRYRSYRRVLDYAIPSPYLTARGPS
jgi:hypothetical protein